MAKATGKEKKLLAVELEGQEEKLRLKKSIFELEGKLGQGLDSLHQFLRAAVDRIKRSPYAYDAKGPLSQARSVLNEIVILIKEAKALEDKLVGLVKAEKKLLKKGGKLLSLPINPVSHNRRAPKLNHSPGAKRQLLSGCRIPTLPRSFSLRREFTGSAVENVLTGFQCFLYQFENRFNHFSRFVLWEAGLIIDRLNQIILYRP